MAFQRPVMPGDTRSPYGTDFWSPHIVKYGYYDPMMAGSIDGTDALPHDRAVVRAMSSRYKPKTIEQPRSNQQSSLFIGRLPPTTRVESLQQTLNQLLRSDDQRRDGFTDRYRSRTNDERRARSRSPFAEAQSSKQSSTVRIRVVRNLVTGYPCGYAFAEFDSPACAERVLQNWRARSRSADTAEHRAMSKFEGFDIPDGGRVILEPAFCQTLPGWRPRRLGGGLGGRKEAGQLRFGGVSRPFRRPFSAPPR